MNLTVTNRDLLRRYKELKNKLMNGEIKQIIVPQSGNVVIKLSVEKEKTPTEEFLEMIKKHPIKNVKRPEEDII